MYSSLAIATQNLQDELYQITEQLDEINKTQNELVFYECGDIMFENIEYDRKLTRKKELLLKIN